MSTQKPVQVAEALGTDPLASLLGGMQPAQNAGAIAVVEKLKQQTELKVLPAIPASVLGDEGRRQVDAALQQLPVNNITLQQIILLGSDVQKRLGGKIDALLDQVGKKEASILYELFQRLAEGIEEVNLDELEEKMLQNENPGLLARLTDGIGLTDPKDRSKKLSDGLRDLLTSKSETLRSLVQGMEKEALSEVQRLMTSLGQIDTLARSYLEEVHGFAVATQVVTELHEKARGRLSSLIEQAEETSDPHSAAQVRDFNILVDQLQNRRLALRTAYEGIPANLEVLNVARGAASTTLAETANGIQQEFNDLKGALLQWHVLLTQQDLQNINAQRRRVTEAIRRHNVVVLDRVASSAAAAQGDNRLEDAKVLLDIGRGLVNLRTKIDGIEKQRQEQFSQAESALAEAREIFAKLPSPEAVMAQRNE